MSRHRNGLALGVMQDAAAAPTDSTADSLGRFLPPPDRAPQTRADEFDAMVDTTAMDALHVPLNPPASADWLLQGFQTGQPLVANVGDGSFYLPHRLTPSVPKRVGSISMESAPVLHATGPKAMLHAHLYNDRFHRKPSNPDALLPPSPVEQVPLSDGRPAAPASLIPPRPAPVLQP